jgi:hypothetical protein
VRYRIHLHKDVIPDVYGTGSIEVESFYFEGTLINLTFRDKEWYLPPSSIRSIEDLGGPSFIR